MHLALPFFLISLAAALGLPGLCRFSFWWALPLFLASELLLHAGLVLVIWLCCRRVDRDKPLERLLPGAVTGTRIIARLLCDYGGLRPVVLGEEKLPREPFLIVCNHRSMFDPLMGIVALEKHNISYISKPSNMQIPLIGDIAYAAGFLPIDRENDRNALKTILAAADYLKRGMCSMCIFPEGTRSRTGRMGDFHPGSFKIAQRAGVPLVIACVRDTEKASRRLFLRPTKVYLDILEVLPAEQVKAMSTRELADYSKGKMLDVLGE